MGKTHPKHASSERLEALESRSVPFGILPYVLAKKRLINASN
ncbi:hypothetical protein [uncultured Acinetobacter sp.]|nr:hypothetical protein [uncultured Acinetobacter sp.]